MCWKNFTVDSDSHQQIYTHLADILEELNGHLDQNLVLIHACLESLMHTDELIDNLFLLATSVALQG